MLRPAVLLGAGPRVVLTIARSLRRRGIPVIVALTSAGDRWAPSRAVSRVVRLGDAPDARADALEALVRESGASWVAPCSDTALVLLCACHERIARHAHVAAPPPEVLREILDKTRTLERARAAGLPVPREIPIGGREALAALPALPFPLVAKPADKGGRALHPFKVRHFATRDELVAAFAGEARFGDGLLFQEFVPGDGVGVEVLMHDGEALACFQHRRLRELPASGGVAVTAVSEPVDPVLGEHAVRLLRALRWQGVAMVEFRHDRRTGQAALMEVNGRFWGSLALPVQTGYDFPYWQWQLDHGQRPAVPPGYPAGVRMRWGTGDLLRLHDLFIDDATPGAVRRRAVAEFVADFRPGVHPALWSWTDPLPAMVEAGQAVRRVARRLGVATAAALMPRQLTAELRLARQLGGSRGRVYLRRRLARALGQARARLPRPWRPRTVLFVCHGNIMRSAVAAEQLRTRLLAAGDDSVVVLSAGVRALRGQPAHPRVRALAGEFGLDLSHHAAQPVTAELVRQADTIFVMDDRNVAFLLGQFPHAAAKTLALGGVRGTGVYRDREIADPYHGDDADARAMIADVCGCVDVLADVLLEGREAPVGTAV